MIESETLVKIQDSLAGSSSTVNKFLSLLVEYGHIKPQTSESTIFQQLLSPIRQAGDDEDSE